MEIIMSILFLSVFCVFVYGAGLIVCDKQAAWNARHKTRGNKKPGERWRRGFLLLSEEFIK